MKNLIITMDKGANKKKEFVPFFDIPSIKTKNTNNKLSIVSIVHNQAEYIEDWIKFHYIAGVTDFYFYIDSCTDNTVDKINSMTRYKGIRITTIPWTILSKIPSYKKYLDQQILSYVHAILNFGHQNEWMTFIDTDEYLVPIGKRTIIEAISHLKDYSNISLQHTMFGSNGHKSKPKVGDIFAYTKKVDCDFPGINKFINIKCIVKPYQVNSVYIHRFMTNDMGKNTVNDIGKLSSNKKNHAICTDFASKTKLQLNHYYIRSEEDFITKINWYKNWSKSNLFTDNLHRAKIFIDNNAIDDTSVADFLTLHGIDSFKDFKNYYG